MKTRFWAIYLVVMVMVLGVAYALTADTSSSPFALSDAQMSAIKGADQTWPDQECLDADCGQDEPCVPNSSHNYIKDANSNYKECQSHTGYNCTEYGNTNYCVRISICDNNCDYCQDWEGDDLPYCY